MLLKSFRTGLGKSSGRILKQAVRRAQLVTRFLDWLVEQRALESNPFREMRQKYCRRESTAAVVRALVSENPQTGLAALRGLPAYGSHLGRLGATLNECSNLGFATTKEDSCDSIASCKGMKEPLNVPLTGWSRNMLNQPEQHQVTSSG